MNKPLERLGQIRLKSNSYTVATAGGEQTFNLRPIIITPGHVERIATSHFGSGVFMREVRTGKFNIYRRGILGGL